jgi:hypothetical protein
VVDTTKLTDDPLATLREPFQDLGDRLEDARDRAEHLRDDVREQAEHVRELVEELEPATRQARIKGWELVRQVIGALLVLPRLAVRLLGALPPVVEGAAEQGGELADRARHVAGTVPQVRRHRQRRRLQLAAWTAGGFAAGVVTGWLLARRQPTEMIYESTQGDTDELPIPDVDATSPFAPDVAVRE